VETQLQEKSFGQGEKMSNQASGPKVYRIPVLWQMAGEIEVQAEGLEKALALAAEFVPQRSGFVRQDAGSLAGGAYCFRPVPASYIEDSLSVDLEGVRIRYPDEVPPAVKHVEYDKPVPANEGEEIEPDIEHHCDGRDTPPDRGYWCTRRAGHEGPHVAHFSDGQMIARWPSVQPDSGR
jgi:hypothetical protein